MSPGADAKIANQSDEPLVGNSNLSPVTAPELVGLSPIIQKETIKQGRKSPKANKKSNLQSQHQ